MDIYQLMMREHLQAQAAAIKPKKLLTEAEKQLVAAIRAENKEILAGKSRDEDWRISANCRAIRRILGPDSNG